MQGLLRKNPKARVLMSSHLPPPPPAEMFVLSFDTTFSSRGPTIHKRPWADRSKEGMGAWSKPNFLPLPFPFRSPSRPFHGL